MRWDALFADLEAQLAAASAVPDQAAVAELVRAEVARTTLTDRLRAHAGSRLGVRLRSGTAVAGVLLDAGPDWLLLDAEGAAGRDVDRAQVVVPSAAVLTVSGLSRTVAPPAGAVERRLGLGSVLRALASRRVAVRLDLLDRVGPGDDDRPAHLAGTIDRVGADHLDLAVHPVDEPRRASAVREVLAVPLAALAAVRSSPS